MSRMSSVKILTVDLSRVNAMLDRDRLQMAFENAVDVAILEWDRLIDSSMSARSAAIYKRGISRQDRGPREVVLQLEGALPLMLERGWYEGEGVDLRNTLLRGGRGVKTSKSGHRYRVISFRHQLEGVGHAGDVVGAAHSRVQGAAAGAAVADTVRQAVRGAPVSGKGRDGKFKYRYINPGTPKLRERHTTGIHERMIKVAGGRGYRTFRTISTNPDSVRTDSTGRNWHHPGIVGRRLMPRVGVFFRQALQHELGGDSP